MIKLASRLFQRFEHIVDLLDVGRRGGERWMRGVGDYPVAIDDEPARLVFNPLPPPWQSPRHTIDRGRVPRRIGKRGGDYELVARQVLRAIRGRRSQVAFSRRLGYRGNAVADWEAGRRFPTAARFLEACERAGIDVAGALYAFDRVTGNGMQSVTDYLMRAAASVQSSKEKYAEAEARANANRPTRPVWFNPYSHVELYDEPDVD